TAPNIPFDQGNFDERFGGPAPVAPQPAPMEQYTPGQVVTGPDGQTYQNVEQLDGSYALSRYNPNANQPSVSPSLLAQNDMMLGGALSPTGRSEVAQALTGYFPDAPSANRAPITAQNNAMSQAPMQQPTGGV